MPSSRHARITRRAISPRFAIRIFLNTADPGAADRAHGSVGGRLCANHQGVKSEVRLELGRPASAMSLRLRSDAELIPEARSANSLGLVE
jgi:hypothetical protein